MAVDSDPNKTQGNSNITYAAATAVGRANNNEASRGPIAKVIDLQAHRRAAAVKAQASAIEQPDCAGTPAKVWDALVNDRLVMHYQPQYEMRTGTTVAAEALVRFIDTDGKLVYPENFIGAVEESDLIVSLGRAVIEQVCADLAACRAEGHAIRRMAINLSARQLKVDTSLLSFIDQIVARNGLTYVDLEFELTERQCLRPTSEGLHVLNALASRGARIVIDDFGVGYSSIVYLTELPVSAFKLDLAFIRRLPEDGVVKILIENLLALATNLNLDVIAEGVETLAQHEFLCQAGCAYAQGFGFAKPMNVNDLQSFMNKSRIASSSAGSVR